MGDGVPSPVLAVGAVVVDDERLLLVKRGRDPGAGLWSLPGGRVEAGETMAEAVAREVLEETRLRVHPTQLLGWVERKGDGWHYIICDYSADLIETGPPVPVAGDDAAEAAFVSLDEVADLPLVRGLRRWLFDHGVL